MAVLLKRSAKYPRRQGFVEKSGQSRCDLNTFLEILSQKTTDRFFISHAQSPALHINFFGTRLAGSSILNFFAICSHTKKTDRIACSALCALSFRRHKESAAREFPRRAGFDKSWRSASQRVPAACLTARYVWLDLDPAVATALYRAGADRNGDDIFHIIHRDVKIRGLIQMFHFLVLLSESNYHQMITASPSSVSSGNSPLILIVISSLCSNAVCRKSGGAYLILPMFKYTSRSGVPYAT